MVVSFWYSNNVLKNLGARSLEGGQRASLLHQLEDQGVVVKLGESEVNIVRHLIQCRFLVSSLMQTPLVSLPSGQADQELVDVGQNGVAISTGRVTEGLIDDVTQVMPWLSPGIDWVPAVPVSVDQKGRVGSMPVALIGVTILATPVQKGVMVADSPAEAS